jgi:hypothetical protein
MRKKKDSSSLSWNKEYKIEETRKRSLLKSITGLVFEILFDTLFLGLILSILGIPHSFEYAGGFAIIGELVCVGGHYFNDRCWNRIGWGRSVQEGKEKEA